SSGLVGDSDIRSVELESVLSSLRPGQPVGLRVKANVARTVNRTENGLTKTHREPLDPDAIEPWFASAVEGALQNVKVDEMEFGIESQRSVPIAVVTIDASAAVVNAEALIRLVGAGIGRAKAFGCGMISVRPLPSARRL
ncbi:CRISPR-associated protein, CT1974, partial [mine drainage metagenome]